jgi:hypothetical protein
LRAPKRHATLPVNATEVRNMKCAAKFVLILSLTLCPHACAQTLVYSLSYSETRASFHARFANVSPLPGLRSEAENLAMLRNTRKNEIYSISLADGKRSLLFSDEGLGLEIGAAGSVSGSAKAYSKGTWRYFATIPVSPANSTPYRGVKSEDGIYELSMDGSHHFRKIADAQKPSSGVLNPQATKAAAESADGQSIFVYSVPDWKLLATMDLQRLARMHCPGCAPASYGWMADGNRLYVELVVVGEEDDDEAKADHPGTYIVSGDGADLGAIPAKLGAFQLVGYVHPNFVERRFIGQLPDGRYLFLDYAAKQGKPINGTEPFLVIAGADSKLQKAIPLKFPIGSCYISPSGKYLAYIERRQTPDYRSELHLWVKNLESGEDKQLLATPPPNPPSSPEPNVTLALLGWMN